MREDLLEIIGNYSVPHQLKKLNEEMFEFCEAVLEYYYLKDSVKEEEREKLMEHIYEEYGDVEVVLSQFKYLYNLDLVKLEENKSRKILRQRLRMIEENDKKFNNIHKQ